MGKLNIFLLMLVVFCASQLVESQHEARRLFVELGRERQAERQLEVAFTRLQLDQATLAKGERVDSVARSKLKMITPSPNSIVFMSLSGGGTRE
jgi:cell division protein FtsL